MVRIEVTGMKDFMPQLLTAFGLEIEKSIVAEIDRMKLVNTGELRGSIISYVGDNALIIESTAEHAPYLEYGTLEYFNKYGINKYPLPGYPSIPKKKELTVPKNLPTGVQPFAFFRRVIYNQKKMQEALDRSVKFI